MLTACATVMLVQLLAASPEGAQRSAGRSFAAMGAAGLNSTGIGVLSVPQSTIHLEPITVQELVGDARQPLPEANLTGQFQNGAFIAHGGISPAPLPTVVRRPLRGVWRLAGPNGRGGAQRVRVALESPEGKPGVLSSPDDPRQQLPVAVTESGPRAVSLGRDVQGLEGDVVLEIPTSALGSASHYRGRLVIRIEGY